VQLDFNLPERFEISYTDEEGNQQIPVLIHRAPLGSFERFFSRMIEHSNGAFPIWLSPVQVVIIPISDSHAVYASEVKQKLISKDIRVSIDSRTETMQAKIRDAEMDRVPYMLIVGDKEVTNKGVSVRPRHGKDIGLMSMDEFIARITGEIKDYH
jgi:threonyl-tRNA synthetase